MERIEAGKLQLNMGQHNMTKIIQEVLESVEPAALAKPVLLQSVPPICSRDVLCDKDRVMQVLSNLIGNALKFSPKGGSIVLGTVFGQKSVQVSVTDSGPGVPQEKQSKIFERYTQIGVTNRVGLGLGLYISKMLIEAHHGRLRVISKPNTGSTFSFTIPCASSPKE